MKAREMSPNITRMALGSGPDRKSFPLKKKCEFRSFTRKPEPNTHAEEIFEIWDDRRGRRNLSSQREQTVEKDTWCEMDCRRAARRVLAKGSEKDLPGMKQVSKQKHYADVGEKTHGRGYK